MQTIQRILRIDGSIGTSVDEIGKELDVPKLTLGIRTKIRLDLRSSESDVDSGILTSVNLSDYLCESYYIALDVDYDRETPLKLLKTSGITLKNENGTVWLESELPDTALPELMEAVATREMLPVNVEIGGYNTGGDVSSADFVIQFKMLIGNRVWFGSNIPPYVPSDPEYLNAVQVKAEIAKAVAEAVKGIKGPPGTGIESIQKTASNGRVDTYTVTLEDGRTNTFDLTNGVGIESIQKTGTKGLVDTYTITFEDKRTTAFDVKNGVGIESIQKTGTKGLVDTYTITFEDKRTTTFDVKNGEKGNPGQDFKIDASGKPENINLYDSAEKGFTFASSVESKEDKCTRLSIYVKRTAEYKDWCDPVVITYFSTPGKDGENIKIIPPLEFKAPSETGMEYFKFDLKDYPSVSIGSISIDTEDGELFLPYDSGRGVLKIIKEKTGLCKVWFGANVPKYQTGRIYFQQCASGLTQYQWYVQNGGTLSQEEWLNAGLEAKIRVDAAGSSLSDRNQYNSAPKSFAFGCTIGNKLYIYIKRTDDFADWCEPLVITVYEAKDGAPGENARSIPRYKFAHENVAVLPEGYVRVINNMIKISGIDLLDATVAAVSFNTPDHGEYFIPLHSEDGIVRIYRKDGAFLLYIGANAPNYSYGSVYFSQGVCGLTQYGEYLKGGGTLSFNEWINPLQGAIWDVTDSVNLYGRKKGKWIEFEPGIPDAPKDGKAYARCNGQWMEIKLNYVSVVGTERYNISGLEREELRLVMDARSSDGSEVTFAVTEGSLPAGIALNGNIISGTPEAEGNTVVKITASAGSVSLTITVTFAIAAAPAILKMYYGYIPVEAAQTLTSVANITPEMITAAVTAGTVTEADAGALGKTTITVPLYGWLFAALPKDAALAAKKDDGFGAKVAFQENNGAVGSGANGTIRGDLKYYGEFCLSAADQSVYVIEVQ